MRGLRRKMKWQSGKGGNAGCGDAVVKHFSRPFAFEGFWETVPTIHASLNSPQQRGGPLPGLSHNCSPYHPFIVVICYCSPNIRQLLHHLLRISNNYCIAITPVFSPRFVFFQDFHLWLGDCVNNTTWFLATLGTFLLLTVVSDPGTT